MSCIYRATNTLNGKVYIGFATDFNFRLKQHQTRYKSTNTKFYSAIRKYGWEAFLWEVIYVSLDVDHCHRVMEPIFITEHDSITNGYNTTEGGLGVIGAARNRVWVNDGIHHKRVPEGEIPEGWALGRIGLERKVRTKWSPNRSPRRTYAGGDNPSAKPISVSGKPYSTMREAVSHLGISEPTIRSRCRSDAAEYVDWFYLP